MSLFVAIVPSPQAIEDLEHRVQSMRSLSECRDLRWQPPGRWHVTMAFLGDADDDADECLRGQLDALGERHTGPALRLAGSGTFGRQILWTGVEGVTPEDTRALADLGAAIHIALRRVGFSLERRPWHPHLTVARSRGPGLGPAMALLEAYSGLTWPVDELLAVRSQGGPTPVHTVLHRSHMATP
jgi:2'-5' RNA ligase